MTNKLPNWRLAAANGCVPDLAAIDDPEPIEPLGVAERPDLETPVGSFSAPSKSSIMLPQVQIYEHINFGGHNEITSLNWYYVGDWWNDKISSVVIYSGRWRFYEHWHYQGAYWDLGPGQYSWVEAVGIPNDIISSFKYLGG